MSLKSTKYKKNAAPVAPPRQFNKPIEFDHSLAAAHHALAPSSAASPAARSSLSTQLGLGACLRQRSVWGALRLSHRVCGRFGR